MATTVVWARAPKAARIVLAGRASPTTRSVSATTSFVNWSCSAVQQALATAGRLVPNFDPLLQFPVDVNQWNLSVYSEGGAILTTFEQMVEGTVSPALAHIARRVAGLRYTFTCPLHQDNGRTFLAIGAGELCMRINSVLASPDSSAAPA